MCAPSKKPQMTSDMCRLGCICRALPIRLLHQAPVLHFSSPLASHHTSAAQTRYVFLQTHAPRACARRPINYVHWFHILYCIEMHSQSSPYACVYHHRTQSIDVNMCVLGGVYTGPRRLVCSTRHHSISAVP